MLPAMFVAQPIWERQPNEPVIWYERFTFYREIGTKRSLLAAYNRWQTENGRKTAIAATEAWRQTSIQWQWVRRCEAWDMEQLRIRREVEVAARQEMTQRHIQDAQLMQSIGRRRLIMAAQDLQGADPETARAAVATGEARLLEKEGAAMERQARGLPEHLIAIAAMGDADVLAQYQALVAGLGGSDEDVIEGEYEVVPELEAGDGG